MLRSVSGTAEEKNPDSVAPSERSPVIFMWAITGGDFFSDFGGVSSAWQTRQTPKPLTKAKIFTKPIISSFKLVSFPDRDASSYPTGVFNAKGTRLNTDCFKITPFMLTVYNSTDAKKKPSNQCTEAGFPKGKLPCGNGLGTPS